MDMILAKLLKSFLSSLYFGFFSAIRIQINLKSKNKFSFR